MKKLSLIAIAFTLLLGATAFVYNKGENYKTLDIGAKAPLTNIKMKDISGKDLSLDDIKGKNGLCVIFSCNTCPFVIAWEDRYPEIAKICSKNNVGLVLVNSNEAKRGKADSFEAMKSHSADKNYGDIAYVVDEKSQLANAFGAKTTPHVFLFNEKMELAYRGAIDDNYKSKNKAQKHYLNDAISNLASGKAINPSITPQKGCSIKRVVQER